MKTNGDDNANQYPPQPPPSFGKTTFFQATPAGSRVHLLTSLVQWHPCTRWWNDDPHTTATATATTIAVQQWMQWLQRQCQSITIPPPRLEWHLSFQRHLPGTTPYFYCATTPVSMRRWQQKWWQWWPPTRQLQQWQQQRQYNNGRAMDAMMATTMQSTPFPPPLIWTDDYLSNHDITTMICNQSSVGNTIHHHYPSTTHLDAQTISKPPVDKPATQYEPPLITNHHTQQTYTTQ